MKGTLLFIDDDADVRDAFSDLLEFAGWQVVPAADGLEGLKWLAENPAPAVILLDLKMPRCDGYEFRRRQRRDPRLEGIPTLVFTADGEHDTGRMAMLGDVMVVRKSDEFSVLLRWLDEVTARARRPA